MNFRKNSTFYLSTILVSSLLLSGCNALDSIESKTSLSGPRLDAAFVKETRDNALNRGIEVQAAEEKIDRSNSNWLADYCIARVLEVGRLPGAYEKQRGPFKSFDPIYLSQRHTRFSHKATCNTDFYIWPVRERAFASVGVEYVYGLSAWEEYYDAATASLSGRLKNDGWRVLVNEGEGGVKADYSLSYYNNTENLREYLDIFYTNDEEVVYELLVIDLENK